MKTRISFLLSIFLIVSTIQLSAQNVEHLECAEVWNNLNWTAVCPLNQSHFDIQGEHNICNADSNDSFPFDERISIRIYNHFDSDSAMEEYMDEQDYSESLPDYVAINDLGDKAFGIIEEKLGRLSSAIIEVVTGNYTVQFDVRGNYANNSNNCFTSGTVIEFARSIVDEL